MDEHTKLPLRLGKDREDWFLEIYNAEGCVGHISAPTDLAEYLIKAGNEYPKLVAATQVVIQRIYDKMDDVPQHCLDCMGESEFAVAVTELEQLVFPKEQTDE